MTPALALCFALAATPAPGDEVLRGCALAQPVVLAAEAYGLQPSLLLAVAQRESGIRTTTNKGGYCGPWQVHPRWAEAATCSHLQGGQGAWAAARILAAFKRGGGGLDEALRRYSGSAPGSRWYARAVLRLQARIDRHRR